jgi:hypothetical protein
MLTHHTPPIARLDIDADALLLRCVISTRDRDRAGDIVEPAGLRNKAEFLCNPVVLWAHRRDMPPIGTCERLDIYPDRVEAVTRFARGLAFAEDLFRLYAQGIMRGWSIGFVPRQSERLRNPDGLRVLAWDLLEYSAVPLPENPGALTVAVRKGLISEATWHHCQAPDAFHELLAG